MEYPSPDHHIEQHHLREYGMNNSGGGIGLSNEYIDRYRHRQKLMSSMTEEELEAFNNIEKREYEND